MNWATTITVIEEALSRHWLSVTLLALTLISIGLSLLVRRHFRKRWLALMEQGEQDLELHEFEPFDGKDTLAFEVVKKHRRAVWEWPENRLSLNVDSLLQQATEVVRSVAAVYHPEPATPEYEASLQQSIFLARRVTERLYKLSRFGPFRILSQRKLSDYQKFYRIFRQINENPVIRTLKRHRRLYRIARVVLSARQLGNPFYWAGKDLSREGFFYLLRWFNATYISQVGREAILLYSGRAYSSREEQDATAICYGLFMLSRRWHGPSNEEWQALLTFVGDLPRLDPEAKLQILMRCGSGKFPTNLENLALRSKFGEKWYRKGLERLTKADSPAVDVKQIIIEEELSTLANRTSE